jgi:3-hydroxyisobutyrate dehydrogenase-like beta-hydroxyacid dehydrogenase
MVARPASSRATGIRIMGSAMARNRMAARLPTTFWDRSKSATEPLSEAGVSVAASVGEASYGREEISATVVAVGNR